MSYSNKPRTWTEPCHSVLDAFVKLRKSVGPCVHMDLLGSHWPDFYEIRYLIIFRKYVEKIQIY